MTDKTTLRITHRLEETTNLDRIVTIILLLVMIKDIKIMLKKKTI